MKFKKQHALIAAIAVFAATTMGFAISLPDGFDRVNEFYTLVDNWGDTPDELRTTLQYACDNAYNQYGADIPTQYRSVDYEWGKDENGRNVRVYNGIRTMSCLKQFSTWSYLYWEAKVNLTSGEAHGSYPKKERCWGSWGCFENRAPFKLSGEYANFPLPGGA